MIRFRRSEPVMQRSRVNHLCPLLVICVVMAGCSDNDGGMFSSSPTLGELEGTWVLTNRGVEETGGCSRSHTREWCAQIQLEFPLPAGENVISNCENSCDGERLCARIDNDTRSMTTGILSWSDPPPPPPLCLDLTLFDAVFSIEGDELVISPSTVTRGGGCDFINFYTCNTQGEWRGQRRSATKGRVSPGR